MKKLSGTLILLFAILITIQAQNSAQEILDNFAAKMQALETIEADFTFTLNNEEAGINDSREGSIIIKGDKYILNFIDYEIYFNGEDQFLFMPEMNEVTISKPDEESEDALNPAKIFTMYKEGFKSELAGTKTMDGETVKVLTLYPEDTDKPYSKIELYINNDLQLKGAVSAGKDGNQYIIEIEEFKANVPHDDSEFNFDPEAKGVEEIIDMR